MQSPDDNECLIESLVERDDTFSHTGELTDSLILKVRGDLELLQGHLRQPPPADPFGEESACEQALNLVAAIGRDPSFSTRQQLAAEQALSPDEQSALPGGGVLGQYRLLTKLGEGGMGVVYKALHTRLDKVVALKLLTANRLQNEQAVSRFDREMRAVGKLHHTNIVAAHDAGEIAGTHYLVMELVDGIDLRELVKQHGRLPIGAACELIRQAALGLQHVHAHGLVHRDIKPSNLMLTLPQNPDEAPAVKVLDLGLALLDEAHLENFEELTATGQVMGTLEYMAPEQGADTHSVDIRADIYGLGASLYKLLTGKAPFSSDQYRSPIKLLMALATQDPPPLITRCPEITPELEAVVQRMLAKKPADRYATPRELAEALAPFSHPADLRALVDFLATATTGESVNINAPAFIGTRHTHQQNGENGSNQHAKDTTQTTTYIAAIQPKSLTYRRYWSTRLAVALATCGILIAAAIYVIQIRTEQGELVIQSDYAGVTVKIKRDGEEVRYGWSLLKGQENKQLIRTGQIEIELPAELTGEYTVTPSLVTLTKGDQEVVTIERKESRPLLAKTMPQQVPGLLPPTLSSRKGTTENPTEGEIMEAIPSLPPNVGNPKISTSDRDRDAAKWLISIGGTGMALLELTSQELQIVPAVALPDTPFKLRDIVLPARNLDNDALQHLVGLEGLRHLNINKASKIDGQGISYICQIPRLQVLSLSQSQITTSALKGLRTLPFLHQIYLNSMQVDDNWQFLKELPYLRVISIVNHYTPRATDFRRWGEFPQLRRIEFRDGEIFPADLVTYLREQNPRCQIHVIVRGKGLNRFQDESIVVGVNPIRTGALALLSQGFQMSPKGYLGSRDDLTLESVSNDDNVNLMQVQVARVPPQLKEPDLSGLGQFPIVRLQAIDLQQADLFTTKLPQSTVVENIDLVNSDLTDAGLQELQRLDPFLILNVQGTKVTAAGIEAFKKARPACQVLSDIPPSPKLAADRPSAGTPRATLAVDPDRGAAQGWLLRGGYCGVVLKSNGKTLHILRGMRFPAASFELRSLSAPLPGMLSEDLKPFVGLTGLQSIDIDGSNLDAQAMDYLSQIPSLRRITLLNTQIWTSEFAPLRKLPFLHEITLNTGQIDDDWKFLSDLPHLRSLKVGNYNDPSQADIQKWCEFPQLRSIQLEGVMIPEKLISNLHEKNSCCRVVSDVLSQRPAGAMFGQTPPVEPTRIKTLGVDPVRLGAAELLSHGFRLSSNDRWNEGPELTLSYVRDQRHTDPFTVRKMLVPTTAQFTEPILSGLGKFNIIRLDAADLRQADIFAKYLPASTAVEEINLSQSDLTDAGLQELQRLDLFPVLDVQGTKVTLEGITAFQQAKPACLVISRFNPPRGTTPLDEVPPAPSLPLTPADRERAAVELWQQRLGGGKLGSSSRDSSEFTARSQLPVTYFQLIAGRGTGIKGLTNADLEHLTNLTSLEMLAPWGQGVDAQAVHYLKRMPTVTDFDLTGAQIPTSALTELRTLLRLSQLGLSGSLIDDNWKFLDQLPGVRKLRLSNFRPTPADWQRFQELPQLREIRFLDSFDVDEAAVTELQQKNPLCRVISVHPQLRTIGTDPVREAIRLLHNQGIDLMLSISDGTASRGLAASTALENTLPCDIELVTLNPGKMAKLDASVLLPMRSVPINELWISQATEADAIIKLLPDELLVRRIELGNSGLTDQGLLQLSRISRPERLNVRKTKVTSEGTTAFSKAVPGCVVFGSP